MSSTTLPNLEQELKAIEDNLFDQLQQFAYKFLDRFHYKETDSRARELYAIVTEAQNRMMKNLYSQPNTSPVEPIKSKG